ncbi:MULTISPECIES: DUF3872 domain-containing protein [Chryseobacterium]|jgi:hypothetical protein|uniref:DUF3872 domain-containing protein n=1 Tax=Chryseobacterium TaxID=59732 RepID=UPI001AEB2BB6|nr:MULTISPECIES: DUF3872 domain-containing protein [Chryseobacterium]MBP1164545.1 hypothetical protein [Chryseobacterium sp. PvR013]MDR6461644.1 hypothetical protein [Chryseobacterium sediminis]
MNTIIKIRRSILSTLFILLVLLVSELGLSSCAQDLEIRQNFPFEISVMPVPKDIAKDEYVEIRIKILPEGNFADTQYHLRYFQFEGTGKLQYYNTQPYFPNDSYRLFEREFRLYYTSTSEVSQSFTVWIYDSFGNEKKIDFQFNSKNGNREVSSLAF